MLNAVSLVRLRKQLGLEEGGSEPRGKGGNGATARFWVPCLAPESPALLPGSAGWKGKLQDKGRRRLFPRCHVKPSSQSGFTRILGAGLGADQPYAKNWPPAWARVFIFSLKPRWCWVVRFPGHKMRKVGWEVLLRTRKSCWIVQQWSGRGDSVPLLPKQNPTKRWAYWNPNLIGDWSEMQKKHELWVFC